jgi:hypothetical protein
MRKLVLAVTTSFALLASAMVGSPAQAGSRSQCVGRTCITMNAYPEPVRKCGHVTVGSETWERGLHDHSVLRANFYFRPYGSSRWSYKGGKRMSFSGRATMVFRQCQSGTWNVRVRSDDRNPSVTDFVAVRRG